MKKILQLALGVAMMGAGCAEASAQYYGIANQVTSMLQPALSGSFMYKGFLEAEYLQGIGDNKANFLNFTTSQGFQYSSWFYMGVGAGVDVVFAKTYDGWSSNGHGVTTTNTGVMVPLFSDFRFNIGGGNGTSASVFLDVKLGGAFLLSDNYLAVGDGYISNKEYFYLRPSLGVRIPVSQNHPKQAVDIGVSYQLLTSNDFYYWGGGGDNLTLNAFGANIAFEW